MKRRTFDQIRREERALIQTTAQLRKELSRTPSEELIRACDAINAARPDLARKLYDAVGEALAA